jgi:hypothetical protein
MMNTKVRSYIEKKNVKCIGDPFSIVVFCNALQGVHFLYEGHNLTFFWYFLEEKRVLASPLYCSSINIF